VRVTKDKLRQIIKEEKAKLLEQHFSAEHPGPLEYKLADLIASAWQQDVLAQDHQGTYDSWPAEVEEAATQLEEGLMDSGVLESVLRLVSDVEGKLHNGDYAR
jgi:hypothetical protein